MPERKGYRSDRLRRRRRSRVERSQAWILYVLAGVGRVRGRARRLVRRRPVRRRGGARQEERLPGGHPAHRRPGEEAPVAALLVVQDPGGRRPRRLPGPAGPAPGGTQRRVRVRRRRHGAGRRSPRTSGASSTRPIDAVYTVPVSELGEWAGSGELQVELERPGGGGDRRRHADDQGRRPRADRRPAGDLLRRRGEPARPHDPAGRAGRGGARRGGPAAGRRAQPPRRRQPVAVGGPGLWPPSWRASRRATPQVERFPVGHARRRGAVRLRARPRGDHGRHHAALAGLPRRRDRAGAATGAARSAWARPSWSAWPAST